MDPWYAILAGIVLVPLVLTAAFGAIRASLVLAVGLLGAAGLFSAGLLLRDESAREPLTNVQMLALVAFLFAFWAAGTALGYMLRRYRHVGGSRSDIAKPSS
ncbi:MAG: hypothetical protein ICV64_00865 [Thermoleophilia bacterium]|nr:hypothetical protein [Thermoleophilia bacterium]